MKKRNLTSKEFFDLYTDRLESDDFTLYNVKNSFFHHYAHDDLLKGMIWLVSDFSENKQIRVLDFDCGI